MRRERWILYGAYGYSGRLIAEEAVRRGHRPLLAGRRVDRLVPLAHRLGLDSVILDLGSHEALRGVFSHADVVFNAAGPFMATADPIVRACLDTGTHYIDITGEIGVFERHFRLDSAARNAGITILSGAGFDVVPTDCLAAYVAGKTAGADNLEIAFSGLNSMSRGTLRTLLIHNPRGVYVRRSGRLVCQKKNGHAKRVGFEDRNRVVHKVSWGDLSTAYRSTRIPNITVYAAQDGISVPWTNPFQSPLQALLSVGPFRRLALAMILKTVSGPGPQERARNRTHI